MIYDTPRTYADPVEVAAEAMDKLVWEKAELGLSPGSDEMARAALEALTKHGFLSDQYFDARNAMKNDPKAWKQLEQMGVTRVERKDEKGAGH